MIIIYYIYMSDLYNFEINLGSVNASKYKLNS